MSNGKQLLNEYNVEDKQLIKRRLDFLDEETKDKNHIYSKERKNVNDGDLNKHASARRENSVQDKEFLTILRDNNAACGTQNRPQKKQMHTVQSVNYVGDSGSDITLKTVERDLLKVFDNLNEGRQLEKDPKLVFRNFKALNQDKLVDYKRTQQGVINDARIQSGEKCLRNPDVISQIALQQMLCDNQRVPHMQNLNEHYQRPHQSLAAGIVNQHTNNSTVFSTTTCVSFTHSAADQNIVPDRRNMNSSQTSTHFYNLQTHPSERNVARQTNTNFSRTTDIPQRHCVAVQRKVAENKTAVESNQLWGKPKDHKSLEINKSYSKEKEANSHAYAKRLGVRKENESKTTASKYNARHNKLYKQLECTVKGFDQVSDYIPKYKCGRRGSAINAMNNISKQLNNSDSSDSDTVTKFNRIKRKRSDDTNTIKEVFNLSKKGTFSIKEFNQKYKHMFENQPIVKLHRLKDQQIVKYVKCHEEASTQTVGERSISLNFIQNGIKRNNDREMTEINTRYCVLCYSKPHDMAAHYMRRHKTESYVSRLTEDQLCDLIVNTNFAEPQRSDHKGTIYYKVICYFCNDVLIEQFAKLYDHYSQHTGEYAYVCSCCLLCKPFRADIESHQNRKKACRRAKIQVKYRYQSSGASIYLYFCSICNYVQLNEANVSKHLRSQHSFAEAIVGNVENCVLVKVRRLSTPLLPVNEIQKNEVQKDSAAVPKSATHSRSQSLNINSGESSKLLNLAESSHFVNDIDNGRTSVNSFKRKESAMSAHLTGSNNLNEQFALMFLCKLTESTGVVPDYLFYCPETTCGDFFPSYDKWLHHMRTRHNGFAYYCPHCPANVNQATSDRVLLSLENFKIHFQEHAHHTYICFECLGTFKYEGELRTHVLVIHQLKNVRFERIHDNKRYLFNVLIQMELHKERAIFSSELLKVLKREISEDVSQHEWLVPRGVDWMENYPLCFSSRNFAMKCLYGGCDFLATKCRVFFKHLRDQHEIKGNSFICTQCPFEHASCQSWESIFDHLKIHIDSYVYICCICLFNHSAHALFTAHIRQEHDTQDVPFVQISTDSESTYAELGFVFATGMYIFSTIYNCFCCRKQDMEQAGFVLHLMQYHRLTVTYYCQFCCKFLHDPKSFEDHFKKSHTFEKPKIYCKLAAQTNLIITSIQPLRVNLWERELINNHKDYNSIVF
ncbi:uncharacterized protein ACN2A1_000173 isoform 1-T3 [Glossina fuscipes fuscipes]